MQFHDETLPDEGLKQSLFCSIKASRDVRDMAAK
jgi:hypothetical protein